MVEEGLGVADGILVATEVGKQVLDEVAQVDQRLAPRHRPVEAFETAEVIAEALGDELKHRLGGGVVAMTGRLGNREVGR